MARVSPVYFDNNINRMNRRLGICDIDFSKMSINSPGPSRSRRNSSATYVNSLGAVPQVTRSSTPDSEIRTLRTPEPRLYRRSSISASMKKIRSKVTHVIDRLNVSFSEYIGEHREHTAAAPILSKNSRGKNTIEKILSSGGIRRNKNSPSSSLLHSFKPKNLFRKRKNGNSRDVGTISKSSSCSSLPSLTSMEYLHPVVPMETGSGRVLIYDDLEKSIVSHSFSDHVRDDVNCTEKADVHRSEDSSFEANQIYRSENWVSRVSAVPEEINQKFRIEETLQSLNCSSEKSDESFESRSSCSKIVHPSWSNEQLYCQEDDYVVIERKCPCRMQEEEAEGFILTKQNSLDLNDTHGFVIVNQENDAERTHNSYVLSMYV